MEPEEYIEYFEDTILSRTPKLGQRGVMQRSRHGGVMFRFHISQVFKPVR